MEENKDEVTEIKAEKVEVANTEKTIPEVEKKGLSIAALVLGIVSVACCCAWYLCVPCGILAIIFGQIGKKKGAPKMAKAGFILGIIGVALYVFVVLILFSLIGLGTALSMSAI